MFKFKYLLIMGIFVIYLMTAIGCSFIGEGTIKENAQPKATNTLEASDNTEFLKSENISMFNLS